MFLEVEEGGQDRDEEGQDRDEEAVKFYLIRFIADLPLRRYMGCVIEYLFNIGQLSYTSVSTLITKQTVQVRLHITRDYLRCHYRTISRSTRFS